VKRRVRWCGIERGSTGEAMRKLLFLRSKRVGDPGVFGTEFGHDGSWQGGTTMGRRGDENESVDG